MGSAATDGASLDGVCSWSLNLTYQFWVATERIGQAVSGGSNCLHLLTTGSTNGMDPVYLTRTKAASSLIWDRLFGSFQPWSYS